MADRVDIFDDRVRLLCERKIEPEAFLRRFTEYFAFVPVTRKSSGSNFDVAMLRSEEPDETFFPLFSSGERFAQSSLTAGYEAAQLPLDSIVRQIRLDTGVMINPGTDRAYGFSPPQLQKEIRTFGADTIREEVTPEWLSALNDRFSQTGVPHGERTWRAMAEWSVRNDAPLFLDTWRAELISSWFAAHIKPGADHIGVLAKAAYFYDAAFWPLELPVFLGQPQSNPLDHLSMPASVRLRLADDRNELFVYAKFWSDCVDYYYGISDIREPAAVPNQLLRQLVNASREQLTMASLLLLAQRPNPKAAEASALALEIILKALLVASRGLDELGIKTYRHHLSKLVAACADVTHKSDFQFIASKLPLFPDISARYDRSDIAAKDLWTIYSCTVTAGGILLRHLTDRNTALGMGFNSP